MKKLFIAGGGTGGHVSAGIAIAQEWKRHGGEVYFFGSIGGMEEKMVPRTGEKLFLTKMSAWKGKSKFKKLQTLLMLPRSIFYSLYLYLKYRPDVVVGVGGYASFPFLMTVGVIKKIFNTKVFIHEANSIPGLTNKVLSKFCDLIFVNFESAKKFFPNHDVIVSGNPTRSELHLSSPKAKEKSRFCLFIFGGSQGAHGINLMLKNAFLDLQNNISNLKIIHQTGVKDYDELKEFYKKNQNTAEVQVSDFIHDMKSCYQEADLILCRSGASTLSELTFVAKPCILIPFPHASDDHQNENAKAFEEKGAAIRMQENQNSSDELIRIVIELEKDSEKRKKLEKALESLRVSDSSALIVNKILSI